MSEADEYIEKIDFNVQTKRFTNVLDELINQLSIIMNFSVFVSKKHLKVLKSKLPPEDFALVHNVFSAFYLEDEKEESLAPLVYSSLLKTVEVNPELVEYVKNVQGVADESVKSVMEFVQEIKKVFEAVLGMTGKQEKQYMTKLRGTYHANEFYKRRIAAMEDQLKKIYAEMGGILKNHLQVKERYLEEMEIIKLNTRHVMKQKMKSALKLMCDRTLTSEEKQVELKAEKEIVEEQYEKLLASHLDIEKAARVKKNKVEVQLSAWITKFDSDVGDLELEREKYQGQYDELFEKLDKLNKGLKEQQELLEKCKLEKADEEEKLHAQIAVEFLKNKSARHIQYYWREYNKLIKRRKKK